jgi:hypothetical protein
MINGHRMNAPTDSIRIYPRKSSILTQLEEFIVIKKAPDISVGASQLYLTQTYQAVDSQKSVRVPEYKSLTL